MVIQWDSSGLEVGNNNLINRDNNIQVIPRNNDTNINTNTNTNTNITHNYTQVNVNHSAIANPQNTLKHNTNNNNPFRNTSLYRTRSERPINF